jgi:hypothetical protein
MRIHYYTEINSCPLCGEAVSVFDSIPFNNLYSEKLASFLQISEEETLFFHSNFRCINCNLIYKKKWFSSFILKHLFTDLVPLHPKGWDAISDRFTFENFYKELNIYQTAINENQILMANQFRRGLLSLLDSIEGISKNKDFEFLSKAIISQKLDVFYEERIISALNEKMVSPLPYKRFSGFNDKNLWNYLESVVGKIVEYDELGCPLWGLARIAKGKGIDVNFFVRGESNYWGSNCQKEGKHCSVYLKEFFNIPIIEWGSHSVNEQRQIIGFFQYLDHLNDPISFLDEVFSKYNNAAVILDHINEPVYIQHFTGFTEATMKYIANKYQKGLFLDYSPILDSGNILYLFSAQ